MYAKSSPGGGGGKAVAHHIPQYWHSSINMYMTHVQDECFWFRTCGDAPNWARMEGSLAASICRNCNCSSGHRGLAALASTSAGARLLSNCSSTPPLSYPPPLGPAPFACLSPSPEQTHMPAVGCDTGTCVAAQSHLPVSVRLLATVTGNICLQIEV